MLVNLEILKKAQDDKVAIGLFNTTDTDMLQAAIEAAEEMNSPIIIGTAEVLLPYGNFKLIAPSLLEAAKRATVPVVVHFDHGLSFEKCMEAIKLGFTSVMYDGSNYDIKKNIENTKEIVKIAHAMGVSVEGEIGHVGQAENAGDSEKIFTAVEDAKYFYEQTGVDALAVAIGSAHGIYKKKPQLNFERLQQIRRTVNVPLVLHGGSGISDADFKTAVREGISKINIFTDICLAGERAMVEAVQNKISYLETRNLKVAYMKEEVKKKIKIFQGK